MLSSIRRSRGNRCSTPSGVVSAAPASVVEYIEPAPSFQTVAPALVVECVQPALTFQTVTTQPAYQYGAPLEVQFVVAPTTKKKSGACF